MYRRPGNRPPQRGRPPKRPSKPYNRPPLGARTPGISHAKEVNIPLIPVTVLTGIIAWAIGNLLYSATIEGVPRPLVIGCVFAVLYLILAAIVALFGNAAGFFGRNLFSNYEDKGGVLLLLCAGAVGIFGLAALFQWIYGLDFGQEPSAPTSYVFVIDDSGSMLDNDFQQERYAAIQTVVEGKSGSFPYMVYSFADSTVLLREMSPISNGTPDIKGNSSGQTEMKAALSQVIDDHERGIWEGGSAPKVILFTDGFATDVGSLSQIKPVLNRFVKANISVSTVGLGSVDEALLQEIAGRTGGVYIDISDTSELSTAMASAATRHVDRDLLSARVGTKMNVLYGIFRVLFLTILGTAIGTLMVLAYGESKEMILLSSAGKAFLGALLMEIGTAAGLSAKFMWLILWALISLTLAEKLSTRKKPRIIGETKR